MNKVVIIGNGFDLAHGLKSSYSDFMVNYLNSVLDQLNRKLLFKDDIIQIRVNNSLPQPIVIKSIRDFTRALSFYENNRITVTASFNKYFEMLLKTDNSNWMDIETYYYKMLCNIWSAYNGKKFKDNGMVNRELAELNKFLSCIKSNLVDYLDKEEAVVITNNNNLDWLLGQYVLYDLYNYKSMFLNFNYTNVMKKYVNFTSYRNVEHNQIHGNVSSPFEELIFGYGDITDSTFLEFERSGNDNYLEHIKNYQYLYSKRYQQLLEFLDLGEFEVSILGHSCGMSDRILLSNIFNHINNKRIRYYFYERENGSNDYIEKAYAISRILPSDQKAKLTKLLTPLSESVPLIKNRR